MVNQTLADRRRRTGGGASEGALGGINEDTRLSEGDFQELLRTIDSGLRALPATGQVSCASSSFILA